MLSDISKKEWLSSPEEFEGLRASLGLLAKDIAQVLVRNYGIEWRWVIQPDQQGGVITIFASKISMKYGYIIKIADIENDPHRKEAVKGGGEILERAGRTASQNRKAGKAMVFGTGTLRLPAYRQHSVVGYQSTGHPQGVTADLDRQG